MQSPELTIIIPVYNNPVGCLELISDFYRLHDANMFRLIVVDQTRDGITFDKEEPVHLHVRTYRNLGFSKAMNTGIKLVQTPYMLLANDDVRLLNSKWYEEAKADLSNDDVLATNPYPATRTWDRHGNVVWFWDDTRDDGTRDDRLDAIKDKQFEDYTDADYELIKQVHGSGTGAGTAMFFTLMETNARHYVGLMDEAYWNNGEDYDWNRRCFLTCWKCHKRKSEHQSAEVYGKRLCTQLHMDENQKHLGDSWFEPFRIVTSKNCYIHHQAGVTKEKAASVGEGSSYDLVVMGKNIFNDKWKTPDCPNPDIYGADGALEPNSPWWTEVPL